MSTPLLSAADYEQITGDDAGDLAVTLERATARIAAVLRRPLAHGEHTEHLRVWADGWVYPTVTPVTAATDDDGQLPVEPHRIQTYVRGHGHRVEVSYTGGWTAGTLPADLAEALAWAVHTLRHPVATDPAVGSIPSNVTHLSVGNEFQVSVERGHMVAADGVAVPAKWSAYTDVGGRAILLAAPYRRTGRVA